MKKNGKHHDADSLLAEVASAPPVLPSIAPVWLTREERNVVVKALWGMTCPNVGYREFLSALKKIRGE